MDGSAIGEAKQGVSVRRLSEEYGVGVSTIYDLSKQKDKLLEFCIESDERRLLKSRKTLHRANSHDLDRVLKEWISHRRSESVPLSRETIMSQARRYHDELKIQGSCGYSIGWYQKFQRRNGIKTVTVSRDRGSADHEAAKEFVEDFARIIADEKLSPEQVYNADETSLFWRYCPRRTVTTSDGIAPTGVKDAKERISVLACGNAAGTRRCEQRDNTEDLTEGKITADLLRYANSIAPESISRLEEVDIEEVFNVDNEAPTGFSLTDVAEMVLNDCEHNRSDDEEDVVSTAKRVSTQKTVKMCDKRIEALLQRAFMTEQDIMAVYKIKEKLLQQRLRLTRQIVLSEALKNVTEHRASTSAEGAPNN
ncbi:hypothetical protein M513_12859 [Trichuris suis]|uniref:HTH CENPB-type domain-containing protein n=1 Tax=Trichuris suis TaxID=68888 RepID=A0A085LMS5_9BILA|nr:hypothetical protein M513_12859 [Trichuris suis]